MALEVAEGAVVGDDLEAVADRLEAAPGAVATVCALTDELAQEFAPLAFVEPLDGLADGALGAAA